MATFSIYTSVNCDTLVGKGSGDTYTVYDTAVLTIDQDTRYGLNNTTVTPIYQLRHGTGSGGFCSMVERHVLSRLPQRLGRYLQWVR